MTTLRQAHEMIQVGDIPAAEQLLVLAAGEPNDPFEYLTVRAGLEMRRHQFGAALTFLDCAVVHRRLDFTVHYNRGVALYELGRYRDAAEAHRFALKINPAFAKGWLKLGACHLVLQEFAEALACDERAVGLDPNDAELHIGLGTVISVLGDDLAAEVTYRRALELNPDAVEAETALGFVLLRLGQWERGWPRFESRWRLRPFGTPWDYRGAPLWTGKPKDLEGKRVLLRSEQGFGDTIQFSRYVTLVARWAEKVWLETEPSLMRLVEGLGADVIARGSDGVPEFDIQTSLMSLPLVFGTRLDHVPEPTRFRVAKREIPAKVGICWHGGARPQEPIANADDQRRSIPWEMFAPIADATPCVSLQQEDLREWGCEDWADTAALVRGLELVITVDTAIAHLSASLGVPTWCLLRAGGCWRWLSTGDRTVWYPAMRLYRQPVLSEWQPVIERVVADLGRWVEGRG